MRDTEIMEKGGAAYEARGRVFESPRAYHNPPKSQKLRADAKITSQIWGERVVPVG